MDSIRIRGARTHNLKDIDVDLPRDRLVVITGLSGSGKSSLAFDTLYAEGQRRYVESLSAYARQFLSMMDKPDVDLIEGLSPAISIEQKTTSHNPRSTVGTITEIHDYLRLLFARVGTPHCPAHSEPLEAQTVSQMVDQILALPHGERLMLLAPVVSDRKGDHQQLFGELNAQGFVRARVDGVLCELDAPPTLDPKRKHRIEVVVDRFRVRDDLQLRLAESIETALALSKGVLIVAPMDRAGDRDGDAQADAGLAAGGTHTGPDAGSQSGERDRARLPLTFSANYACPVCGWSLSELEPRLFSFNNPAGACPTCDGLGVEQFFDPAKVVLHPELSLADGAIRGWDRRNGYYFQMIRSLAEHFGFDVEMPWQDLPDAARQRVLEGSGDEKLKLKLPHERGSGKQRVFEGVLPNMARRYRETDSATVREELAKAISTRPCPTCSGSRLNEAARNVLVAGRSLPSLSALPVGESLRWFEALQLPGARGEIGAKVLKEIAQRLRFLVDVGLDYLTLERSAESLSGGEAQRIRLASQIGAGLVGVMYILDEPSIGLHQRDNARLLGTLTRLRDLGNSVIVVEHDEEAIRAADLVLDLGPGAGAHGGAIVAQGSAEAIAAEPASLTGQYLSGALRIAIPEERRPGRDGQALILRGARGNNLRGIDAAIPVGTFCVVTGVSGSGKSTLINDTLYPLAARFLNNGSLRPAAHDAIEGLDLFDKVVDIDQSPIGRTPRSNPATYTGLFNLIRDLFANVPEARARGYGPGRFSFNVKGGRCEACKGDGVIRVEMHFLPDVYVQCDVCQGRRYNRETLEVRYKGKTIDQVLDLTVEAALDFFGPVQVIRRKLKTLEDVGLGYLRLGQAATTLSGGEAQRVKLSRELSKRGTGRTLYILDEPTTGLHFHDVKHLLDVLHWLRDAGNTVVVIEHNPDVIKTADWIIDLGPEGGDQGGRIVATGTPEQIAACAASYTGQFLKPLLARGY
ncbi:excinuclease ABC subunit UvrA [Halochromatium glycolicum]|uniref:UvrABC system protein A n=1 Tax=Halochromatium glycolicum TaxID=85075 RepID=A0AAJ0U1Q5_9GAMM|nr:excinuclease ABC subunit UvrA [Halochromatium glycolicum]MBK1703665.1 excinuclease ABC subunit A [Halochromatium glycolicum]